jgi:hypothetical protein
MKLPPWGSFSICLQFVGNLGESRARRVEFRVFKYAIYFNFQRPSGYWDDIAGVAAGRKVEYLTTKGARRRLGALFRALAEDENNGTIKNRKEVNLEANCD